MDLKFYLNKFLKVDNIENYTLDTLDKLKETYSNFMEKSDGVDPDFPSLSFNGNKKTSERIKVTSKNNKSRLEDNDNNIWQ